MRMKNTTIAAILVLGAGAAPLHAQSNEEIILADPAFSLTFSAGYLATDLKL